MSDVDVVVVGGGAAGLSGALVLARARRGVLVVDAGEPRNAPAAHAHGFLTRDGVPPGELLATGRTEVLGYGGKIVTGAVTAVERSDDGFRVELSSGERVSARALLMATGLVDELPDVEGVRERWGRDVLHCPYCHGYEVRDRPIGVLAGGPLSVHQALLVRQWSDDVTLFLHTVESLPDEDRARLAARGVAVIEGAVERILVADDRLTGVQLRSGTVVPRDVLFVGPYFSARDALLTALGADVEHTQMYSQVVTDADGATSVPGVWAAGNVADAKAQLITAAAAGARAGVAINGHLVHDDVERALRQREAPFSPRTEAELCGHVLAERRHGL